MTKLYYLRGAFGDESLLVEHEETISKLLSGDYADADLEKLKGHSVYSFRLNERARLLFALREVNGQTYLLILDYLPTHDYHKSRFLRAPHVLSHYLEKHAATHERLVEEELAFELMEREKQHVIKRAIAQKTGESQGIERVALDYYHQQVIELNPLQQEAIDVALPAVVSGVAGSGKSCVSLSVLVSYLNRYPGVEQPLLYVSKSRALVQSMNAAWRNLPLAQENPERIHFKTYDDLLPETELQCSLAEQKEFTQWYSQYVKEQAVSARTQKRKAAVIAIDADAVYQEFRIACVYSREGYEALGERQSSLAQVQRSWLYNTYERYQLFLKNTRQRDSALHRWSNEGTYPLVVVDESQDLSHLQLEQLFQLAQNHAIVYCLDSHQRLFDRRSVRPFLLQHFRINEVSHIELNVTYRCPVKIVAAANEVIALKHRLAGGIADKHEAARISASAQEQGLGSLYVLRPEQLQENRWLFEQIGQPYCAVVTAKANIEEARRNFNTPLIFTPEEIKGLEYPMVIAYKVYELSLFREAQKRLDEVGERKLRPQCRPKAGAQDERFSPALNQIYTTYTRAQQLLVLCEPYERHYELLLSSLQRLANEEAPSVACLQVQAANSDWQQQVLIQLDASNDAVALAIFTTKLGRTPEEFQALVRQHRIQVVTVLPVIEVPAAAVAPATPQVVAKPEAKPATVPPKTKKKDKKAESSAVALTPDPTETRYVLALAENFNAKRLALVFNLYGARIWLTLYPKSCGQGLILADLLKQDAHRKIFSSCLVNSKEMLQKIPLENLLKYFVNDSVNKNLFKQLIAIKSNFERYKSNILLHGLCEEAVHLAALLGDCHQMRQLHQLGADLDKANSSGASPALIAAEFGHIEVLRTLKQLGADLDKAMNGGATPVYFAAQNGRVETLRFLQQLGADLDKAKDNGATPAYIAAERGHIEVIRALKELGADLNKAMVDGATPVFVAAQEGHIGVLRTLKELGADLDKAIDNGSTPAYVAAQNGHAEVLRILKELGADIDKAMDNGATPAFIAADCGHIEVLRVLKELGADIDKAMKNGVTPVFVAAERGYVEVLRTLKELGADLDKAKADGATPAFIAAYSGNTEVLCILKELGVDLDEPKINGFTAAYIAAQQGQVNVLKTLIDMKVDVRKKIQASKKDFIVFAQKFSLEIQERMALKISQRETSRDVSFLEFSPLDIAEVMGHASVVELLSNVLSSSTSPYGFFAPPVASSDLRGAQTHEEMMSPCPFS